MIFYPSRIPDPGVKKAPDPGFGSATWTLVMCKKRLVADHCCGLRSETVMTFYMCAFFINFLII
jgi:hypothetical protein